MLTPVHPVAGVWARLHGHAQRPGKPIYQRRSTEKSPRQPRFTHTPARFQPQL